MGTSTFIATNFAERMFRPDQALIPFVVLGAIAQLAERFHGMEEVEGSIPSSSTRKQVRGCN